MASATTSFASAGTVSYTYDVLGRVTSATYANGAVITYTYDPAGNRTQQVVSPSTPPPTVPSALPLTVAFQGSGTVTPAITGGAGTVLQIAAQGAHGLVSINGLSLSYQAGSAGYFPTDSFTYYATNAGGPSNIGTINVTINPQLPAVPATLPLTVAYGGSGTVTPSTTGGAAATLTIATQGSHGQASVNGLSLSYQASSSYSGSDSFTYYASNASGNSNTGTITVSVNPQPPTASNIPVNVPIGSSENFISLAGYVGGGAITGLSVGADSNATVQPSGLTGIFYTPNSGFTGLTDTFTYTVSNNGGSQQASVNVTLGQQPNPTWSLQYVNMNSQGNVLSPSSNNGGGVATAIQIVSPPKSGGTLSVNNNLTFTYGPPSGFNGTDTFTFTASNAFGTSAVATAAVGVLPPAVTANPTSGGPYAYGSQNNPIPLNVTGGTIYTAQVSLQASNGNATASGNTITYTPNSTFFGTDTFQYTVTSQILPSAAATATVTVNPPAPVTSNSSTTVTAGSSNNPVNLNFTYPIGTSRGPTTVAVVPGTGPSHGTASSNGTAITYSPNSGFSGNDQFQYTGTNPGGTSAAVTASIVVTAPAPLSVQVTSDSADATANPSGGYSPYTYSWQLVSGSTVPSISSTTAQSVNWSLPGTLNTGKTFNAVWDCVVTDASGAKVTGSPVNISLTAPEGGNK